MFDKIFQSVIRRFRCFQLQMRIGQREKRRGECFVGCASRISQEGFENHDRAVGAMQGYLETAAEKVPLPFFRCCDGLHLFEQSPRVDGVGFVQIKLGRAQLRSNGPLWIPSRFRETLQRFIGSAQCTQHFCSAELGIDSKTRIAVGRDLSIERQRFSFAMRLSQQLRAPKIRRRTLAQSRIRQ